MFYYLSGELAHVENNTCVIDCGGVGYKLTVSLITSDMLITKLGQKTKLYTHLAVREDGIELFGFSSTEERSCFNHLIGVSGVGPKVAIGVLSAMEPDKFVFAVCTEDVKAIAKAPGVGKKTAARIILELKDKLSDSVILPVSQGLDTKDKLSVRPTVKNPILTEATEALTVLGYDKNSILNALAGIDLNQNVGEIIRLALKKLSR
jgi:Holliday junction DNA helicase RuvA